MGRCRLQRTSNIGRAGSLIPSRLGANRGGFRTDLRVWNLTWGMVREKDQRGKTEGQEAWKEDGHGSDNKG